MLVEVISVLYYVSLPFTTLICHISNLHMIESVDWVQSLLVDRRTGAVSTRMQVLFRIAVTTLLMFPMLLGSFDQK